MAAKVPIRAVFDGSTATGLADYQTDEFIALAYGGLGASLSIGSAGQVLKVNSAADAMEFGSVEAVLNIDGMTNGSSITIADSDKFAISDGGTEKYITASQLSTYITTEIGVNIDAYPDGTSVTLAGTDRLLLSDSGTEKMVNVSQIDTYVSGSTATLTNKTLTSPTINAGTLAAVTITGIANLTGAVLSGASPLVFEGATADGYETTLAVTDPTADRTWTLPNATDTAVGKATTDTLTNKSIDLGTNTLTGSLAEFNAALQSESFVSLTGSETLTNKTLTSPVIATVTGSTITLDSAGDVTLDAGGADIVLKDDGTEFGRFTNSSGELVIKSSSSATTALTMAGANATVAGNLTVTGTTTFNGGTITLGDAATDTIAFGGTITGNLVFEGSSDDAHELTLSPGNPTGDVTVTLPVATDTLVGKATTDTLTNKTIDADNNTLSNIEVDNLKSGVLDTDISSVSASDDTLASAKAVKTYVDAQVTASDLDFSADSGGALSIDLDSETLTFTGGTGIDTTGSTNDVSFAIDSTVATLTGSQTLTNKTLTSPVLNTGISGTAIKDEDDLASDSATHLATQQSIKAYVDAQTTDEVRQDIIGAMLTGNTETLITVTYQDSDGTVDFVVDNNLANYDNSSSAFLTAVPATTNANLIADGTISNTEYQYLNGVSSNIQTQLNTKASSSQSIAFALALG